MLKQKHQEETKTTFFVVCPSMLKGNSLDRFKRFVDRLKESNRGAVKVMEIDPTQKPEPPATSSLTETEITELSEMMGEAVHNLWMEKRQKEKGWHSPEEHPCQEGSQDKSDGVTGKPLCDKCHPCMRPYGDLPDTEKELDREYPKVFLRLLTNLGYVLKKQKEED